MSVSSDSGGASTEPGSEISPPDDWSEAETWAWAEICEGRIADFHARYGRLDPKDPEGWDDTRKLGQAFLETILLDDPYRSAIPRRGVRILGAWFLEPISLANARVEHDLWLHHSRFEASVQLTDMTALGVLSLEGSRFGGKLEMQRLQADRSLFMRGGALFGEVMLRGAKVGGHLDMTHSRFSGRVNMDSLQVGGGLFMSDVAEFGEVILCGAKVGGQLVMTGSRFDSTLNMESIEIGSYLLMRDSNFAEPVPLIFATIKSGLNLSGAKLAGLDLTGARIAGELWLGSGEHGAKWSESSELILRNTVVGALEGVENAWPESLELEGFTYGRLGGFAGARAEDDMASRAADWFIDWLAKDRSFSPQPYQQLAEVFHAGGQTGKAHAVLYAGRERERRTARGKRWWRRGWKWWGLSLLKLTIGYGIGHRYFRALYWVLGLVLLGVAVLWLADAETSKGLLWSFACSLDLLIPIVELNKEHSEFVMETLGIDWVKYYFYLHKLVGWFLASFLIAGLAGLTQK